MNLAIRNDEDGAFWGAFVEGHVPLDSFPVADLPAAIKHHFGDAYDADDITVICDFPIEHAFITDISPTGTSGFDGEDMVWVCKADAPGARPVTGIFE